MLICQLCYQPVPRLVSLNQSSGVHDTCIPCFSAVRRVYPEGRIPSTYKLKFRIMLMLGGRCSCCGNKDIEFLRLDTVNMLRVLCDNCFTATRNGKLCPHKKPKPVRFIE